jgi:uncharacterized delta-60 repeat protein
MRTLLGGVKIRAIMVVISAALTPLVVCTPGALAAGAGSLDGSFGNGGFATVALGSWVGAAAVVVQPDGKIVTAGEGDLGSGNVIVSTRMTASGALDPTYGNGGIVTVDINGGAGVDSGAGLALQTDGKIVIAGGGRYGTYGPITFAAVRLTSSGALDPTFGTNGVTTVPIGTASIAIANAVVIQSDGKIALAGTALTSHNQFVAVRLNANGTLDNSFGTAGISTLSPAGGAWGLALQGDGKLILAGQADFNNPQVAGAQQFMAARLTASGGLDATYGHGGIVAIPVGATALGYGIVLQGDGKAVLAGPAFTTTGVNATVRLNVDGTIDHSFGNAGISAVPDWYGANAILLDGSGRILLPAVGASVLRLQANGSPDQTFGNGGNALATIGTSGGANGGALAADGKIVLAGAANINGRTVLTVIRLNAGTSSPAANAPAHTAKPARSGSAKTLPAHAAWVSRTRAACDQLLLARVGKAASRSTHRRSHKRHHVVQLLSHKGLCAA